MKNRFGYTLVEVVIVIVILAIISAAGAQIAINYDNDVKLTAAADKLSSDIRYCIARARNKRFSLRIEFDIINGYYRAYHVDKDNNETVIEDPFIDPANSRPNDPTSRLNVSLSSKFGVNISTATFGGDNLQYIGINELGEVVPPDTYFSDDHWIENKFLIVLEKSGETRSIEISPLTGVINLL